MIAAGVLAGCGGSGQGSGTPTASGASLGPAAATVDTTDPSGSGRSGAPAGGSGQPGNPAGSAASGAPSTSTTAGTTTGTTTTGIPPAGGGTGGGSTPASTATTAPAGKPGTLPKAAFIQQADRVCAGSLAAIDKLPAPTSDTDYAGLAAYAQGVITLYEQFTTQIDPLIARSADKAELIAKWRAPEDAVFKKVKPQYDALAAAAKAGDGTRAQQILTEISSSSDDGVDYSTFLQSYGLTDCANLESGN